MRLIFLRHPQTIANEKGVIYGKKDYPYTPLGKGQLSKAVTMSRGYKFDGIITSPTGRAYRLAKAIQDVSGAPIETNSSLEELGYGILEGLTVEEGKEMYPEVMEDFLMGEKDFLIPQGEAVSEFYHRIHIFLDKALKRNEDLLIVSHGGVIRTAIEYLLDVPPGFSWQLKIENCTFIEITCDKGTHQLTKLVNI